MNQRFCTECGQRLTIGDKFCPSCGTKVSQPQDEETRATPDQDELSAEPEDTVPHAVPAQEEKTSSLPEANGTKNLSKGYTAFAEMWAFIAQMAMAPSAEEKREYRREAKMRMYRAPLLTFATPVTVLALLALFIVLDIKTKVPVFALGVVAFAVISLFLIPLLLIIFFTKLTDEDKAKLSAAEVWTGDVTSQRPTRNIGCLVQTMLFLFVVGLIGYAAFSFKDDFLKKWQSRQPTAGELQVANLFKAKAAEETVSDSDCIIEAEIALNEKDFDRARRWLNRIKDDRMRRLQLAILKQQEEGYYQLQQLEWKINSGNW